MTSTEVVFLAAAYIIIMMLPGISSEGPKRRATSPDVANNTCRGIFVPECMPGFTYSNYVCTYTKNMILITDIVLDRDAAVVDRYSSNTRRTPLRAETKTYFKTVGT